MMRKALFKIILTIRLVFSQCLKERDNRMIKSMTGCGHAQKTLHGRDITVEMRSVNHKYFDCTVKSPRGCSFVDDAVRGFVKARVARGKVDVFVTVANAGEVPAVVELNEALAAGYIRALRELGEKFGLTDDLTVSAVARYTDIFTVRRPEQDEDELQADVLEVLEDAMAGFIAMREAEGIRLREDIRGRAGQILSLVAEVERLSPQTLEDYKTRLRARIEELRGDAAVDEQRLLTEIAIFADKIAVDEETVRLRSHFDQLARMLDADEAVGRKLDFIVQEMNREANTIGSKAQNSDVAHLVVAMKAEIEKIREQVQNIE